MILADPGAAATCGSALKHPNLDAELGFRRDHHFKVICNSDDNYSKAGCNGDREVVRCMKYLHNKQQCNSVMFSNH